MTWRVRRLTGAPLRGRLVLDKILHDYPMAPAILDNPGTVAVLLLRQPVEAIQSIVHMGTHLHADERNACVMNATNYYVQRVRMLTRPAKRLGARAAVQAHAECLSAANLHCIPMPVSVPWAADRRTTRKLAV